MLQSRGRADVAFLAIATAKRVGESFEDVHRRIVRIEPGGSKGVVPGTRR